MKRSLFALILATGCYGSPDDSLSTSVGHLTVLSHETANGGKQAALQNHGVVVGNLELNADGAGTYALVGHEDEPYVVETTALDITTLDAQLVATWDALRENPASPNPMLNPPSSAVSAEQLEEVGYSICGWEVSGDSSTWFCVSSWCSDGCVATDCAGQYGEYHFIWGCNARQ